jgi:hypothetical protein
MAQRTLIGRLTGLVEEHHPDADTDVTLVVTVGTDPGRRVEVPLDATGWEVIARATTDKGNH